ncbi:MAG: 2-dehydropantoate 2-reductase [Rhizobiaceae bacterium]|nr:2-dehydropantoate 2-reductase [Rhizobiaceae bacterium]
MNNNPVIAIAGAGSIGCFVGSLLVADGRDVVFLARPRMRETLKSQGIHLTDYAGLDLHLSPEQLDVQDSPEALAKADVILVCVKSGATATMAETIRAHAKDDAVVISLQNGVRNGEILSSILPHHDVRSGMVPFNVVQVEPAHFHRGTSGAILVETGEPDMAEVLAAGHLEIVSLPDMKNIQWGKLLINLSNALNALADIPLLDQISDRKWRRATALQIDEAMQVLKAEGIKPVLPVPLPAFLLSFVLRLPNPLFKRIAKRMLTIDPRAHASMWKDLKHGKPTEINELQGEIIRLGEKHGIATPYNFRVEQKILEAEKAGSGPPGLGADLFL